MKVFCKLTKSIHGFAKWEIKRKLMLSYIVIMIVSMLILESYSYVQLKNQAESNMNESMDVVLRTKCMEIENEISKAEMIISNIIRNKSLYEIMKNGYLFERDGYQWQDMEEIFIPTIEGFLRNNTNINKISIYTAYDLPEVGSMLLREKRIHNEDWYKTAREEYGIKWFYENDRCFAVCEFIDLWDTGHEHIATVYFEVNNGIFRLQNRFDDEGIYRYRIEAPDGHMLYTDSLFENEAELNEHELEDKVQKLYFSKDRVSDKGFVMRVYCPKESMNGYLGKVYMVMVLMLVLCVVAIGALGAWFSDMMTANIRKLNTAMNEIGNGNFDVEISVNSQDEVGAIATQLKKMLGDLKETIQKLYEIKIEKQKQEITTLQSQINPHFLYNILSTIKWTAIEESADNTADIVGMLADFYRTGLNRGDTFISMKDEILNVKAYVNMELIIHDNDFEVEYNLDEKMYEYKCISFILQPIVENAIFHGVKGKKGAGEGRIVISSCVEENIEISICDNGGGMSDQVGKEVLLREGKGYGLANIQRRIKLIHGDEYGLNIQSGEGGTCVKVILPKNTDMQM